MDNNLVEIVLLLDKSGSMASQKNDAIGGYNTLLEEQKKLPGDVLWSTIMFDDRYNSYRVVVNRRNIKDVEPLNETMYKPNGSTAMIDAIGQTIDKLGEQLNNTPEHERPSKVIVAILTDGEENSSDPNGKYKADPNVIRNMIKHQEDVYNWQFLFLASGIDNVRVAQYGQDVLKMRDTKSFSSVADSYTHASKYFTSARQK